MIKAQIEENVIHHRRQPFLWREISSPVRDVARREQSTGKKGIPLKVNKALEITQKLLIKHKKIIITVKI